MNIKPRLNYYDFIENIKSEAEKHIDEGCLLKRHKVVKNNNVVLEGLLIKREGENLIPTIYLESYYKNYLEGVLISDIVCDIIKVYHKSFNQNQFLNKFTFNYDDVKEKITFRLINYEKNIKLLDTVPYERLLDLAVVYYCILHQEEDSLKSVIITNDILHKWNIDYQILKQNAEINTKRLLPSVINEMNAFLDEAAMDEKSGLNIRKMYILTNQQGVNGASSMLYNGVMEEFRNRINKDFYILPSSIHELILLPADKGLILEELKDMVREINESQVADEEVLSDNAYLYSDVESEIQKYYSYAQSP